jgi:hypothetical protein
VGGLIRFAQMLDLSLPPLPVHPPTLRALLHPPSSRLPSLRVLGLRNIQYDQPRTQLLQGDDGDIITSTARRPDREEVANAQKEWRRGMTDVIRGEGRKRWIEVVWD